MTSTYRGTLAKRGATAIALSPGSQGISLIGQNKIGRRLPSVYIVGAQAPEVLKAISTSMNFPNPPAGASTAMMSPPTSLPLLNPAAHEGIPGAAAAKAAPIMCHDI